MADDWQPGDLALCITDEWVGVFGLPGPGPAKGSINTVDVVDVCSCQNCGGTAWLGFAQWSNGSPEYAARCFTKIRPLTEEEKRQALEENEQDKRVPEKV